MKRTKIIKELKTEMGTVFYNFAAQAQEMNRLELAAVLRIIQILRRRIGIENQQAACGAIVNTFVIPEKSTLKRKVKRGMLNRN